MKTQIIALINKLDRMFSRTLLKNKDGKYSVVLDYISHNVPDNAKHLPLLQQVYWLINDLSDFPCCKNPECNKKLNENHFINFNTGYRQFCSKKCKAYVCFNTQEFMQKSKQTKLDRYGSETWNNHEKSKQTKLDRYGSETWNNSNKTKQTNLEKYGTTCPIHNEQICKQIQKSNKQKYGNECIFKTAHFKKKRIETCIKNFGVPYPMQSLDIQEKSKQTCKDKYGVDYVQQNEEIKNKRLATCLKKYGSISPSQTQPVKDKIRQTCQMKYGVNAPAQNHEISVKQKQKYQYNGIFFDSQPEIALYIWLKDNKIKFEYKPNVDIWYSYKNKIHRYFPDFKINNKLVEIKGDQFFDKAGNMKCPFRYKSWSNEKYKEICNRYAAKYKCMIDNNVQILRTADYKQYLDYVAQKYGKNYLIQFKVSNTV